MRRLLLGLAIAMMAALVPGSADGDDQAIAEHISNKLKVEQQRGNLQGFHLNLRVDRGTVWYQGFVANQQQKNLVLRTAQRAKNLGVVQVVDDIQVRAAGMTSSRDPQYQQASYTQDYTPAPTNITPAPAYSTPAPNLSTPTPGFSTTEPGFSTPAPSYSTPSPVYNSPAPSISSQVPVQMNAAPLSAQQNPMPISYGGGAGIQADNPSLPGYAWPGYAAHPNYGAVTYPKQHSPSAWPYIGPFYPYPQVPLGWRKVTLEWDDGWWMLDFHNK